MKNKTLQTIRKHNLIEKGMHILVGLSGGPDSVCLFDILQSLQDELDLKLYAVHVNHKFRPGAAEEDQAYVQQICESSGVPCTVIIRDCNKLASEEGLTSEEAGRKARYEAFSEAAGKLCRAGIPKEKIAIALAHNANDQCETILFRLMRGTGTDGLSGIPYKRLDENGFLIVRPIMDLSRSEIEGYCKDRNLNPRIDHTNDENIYARNKIRNMLIPYIEENFNENIIETVNRLGKIAAEDKDYLRTEAEKAYAKALDSSSDDKEIKLDTKVLSTLHSAIKFRVYTTALEGLGMEQNITYGQAEAIDKVLISDSPSAMCNLTEGFVALRRYDKLVFRRIATKFDNYDRTSSECASFGTAPCGWRFLSLSQSEFEEYKKANSDKVYGAFCGVNEKDLCIRTRKAGDRISLNGGSKKLQDFLVDQKVPKDCRDSIMLLAKGSKILWVMPSKEFLTENMRQKGRFSTDFAVTSSKGDLVIILEKL